MRRILKYPLRVDGLQTVMMPVGAVILTAQLQNGVITMWAEVDDDEVVATSRYFRILGTGEEYSNDEGANGKPRLTYIATVQAGAFVWHVFEE